MWNKKTQLMKVLLGREEKDDVPFCQHTVTLSSVPCGPRSSPSSCATESWTKQTKCRILDVVLSITQAGLTSRKGPTLCSKRETHCSSPFPPLCRAQMVLVIANFNRPSWDAEGMFQLRKASVVTPWISVPDWSVRFPRKKKKIKCNQ